MTTDLIMLEGHISELCFSSLKSWCRHFKQLASGHSPDVSFSKESPNISLSTADISLAPKKNRISSSRFLLLGSLGGSYYYELSKTWDGFSWGDHLKISWIGFWIWTLIDTIFKVFFLSFFLPFLNHFFHWKQITTRWPRWPECFPQVD